MVENSLPDPVFTWTSNHRIYKKQLAKAVEVSSHQNLCPLKPRLPLNSYRMAHQLMGSQSNTARLSAVRWWELFLLLRPSLHRSAHAGFLLRFSGVHRESGRSLPRGSPSEVWEPRPRPLQTLSSPSTHLVTPAVVPHIMPLSDLSPVQMLSCRVPGCGPQVRPLRSWWRMTSAEQDRNLPSPVPLLLVMQAELTSSFGGRNSSSIKNLLIFSPFTWDPG